MWEQAQIAPDNGLLEYILLQVVVRMQRILIELHHLQLNGFMHNLVQEREH